MPREWAHSLAGKAPTLHDHSLPNIPILIPKRHPVSLNSPRPPCVPCHSVHALWARVSSSGKRGSHRAHRGSGSYVCGRFLLGIRRGCEGAAAAAAFVGRSRRPTPTRVIKSESACTTCSCATLAQGPAWAPCELCASSVRALCELHASFTWEVVSADSGRREPGAGSRELDASSHCTLGELVRALR